VGRVANLQVHSSNQLIVDETLDCLKDVVSESSSAKLVTELSSAQVLMHDHLVFVQQHPL
jgi:hypothetical protein